MEFMHSKELFLNLIVEFYEMGEWSMVNPLRLSI